MPWPRRWTEMGIPKSTSSAPTKPLRVDTRISNRSMRTRRCWSVTSMIVSSPLQSMRTTPTGRSTPIGTPVGAAVGRDDAESGDTDVRAVDSLASALVESDVDIDDLDAIILGGVSERLGSIERLLVDRFGDPIGNRPQPCVGDRARRCLRPGAGRDRIREPTARARCIRGDSRCGRRVARGDQRRSTAALLRRGTAARSASSRPRSRYWRSGAARLASASALGAGPFTRDDGRRPGAIAEHRHGLGSVSSVDGRPPPHPPTPLPLTTPDPAARPPSAGGRRAAGSREPSGTEPDVAQSALGAHRGARTTGRTEPPCRACCRWCPSRQRNRQRSRQRYRRGADRGTDRGADTDRGTDRGADRGTDRGTDSHSTRRRRVTRRTLRRWDCIGASRLQGLPAISTSSCSLSALRRAVAAASALC